MDKPAERIYRENAIDALGKKDFDSAARFYCKAAQQYRTKHDNSTSPSEKEYFKKEYNFCVKKMNECKNPEIEYLVPEKKKPRSKTTFVGKDGIPIVSPESLEGLLDDEDTSIKIEKQKPTYDFDAVGGMDDLKETFEVNIMDSFIKPCIYDEIDESNNQSYILYGPPGCGKTYILRGMVGELNKKLKKAGKKEAVLIEADISEIKNKYVGNSEKHLKEYFKEATKNTPCVLFFDELDSLGQKRSTSESSRHASDLLTAFLKHFEIAKGKDVIIVGATNRPGTLDSALTRPERFGDNLILVGNPDYNARKEIFKVGMRKAEKIGVLSDDIDVDELAALTEGYSSVDIRTICSKDIKNYAKKKSRRTGKTPPISQDDFVEVIGNRESSLKRWVSDTKKDLIDMNIYKHKKQIEFKSGKGEYFDMLQLAFNIEGKQIVNVKGVYKVVPLKKYSPDDFIDDGDE